MNLLRILLIQCFLMTSLLAWANNDTKQTLTSLFEQAEQCYLTDDYEQLKSCMNKYSQIFDKSALLLGDSLDVYYAYYNKIRGAYYYGLTKEKGFYSHCSEQHYRTSLSIFSLRNSEKNVITLHEELAQLYYKIKNYSQALLQLDTIYSYYDYHLNDLGISTCEHDYYRTLSQLAICHARLGHFEIALRQITEAQKYFKKRKSEFYYETLRRQGKILMLQADSLGTDRYMEARKYYEHYIDEECATIAQRLDTMSPSHRAQHWLATHRFLYDCYRLGSHAPELLYNLALFSKGYLLEYESNSQTQQIRWEQVRKKLSTNDCALEFVQYFGRHDEKRMGCLVLHSSGKPKFIDLFATDSLLSLQLTSPFTVGDAFDAFQPDIKDSLYRDNRLSQLIWPPHLMAAIGKANKVYFAPDGLIHQWAIEYLMPDSHKICYRLSSTRNLVHRSVPLKMQSALFCGGIAFRAAYNPSGTGNDYMAYRYLKPRVGSINSLPNTKIEVDSIFACRNNFNDTLLKDDTATDENLVQLLQQKHYDVVHISTHGHYIGHIDIHNDLRPLSEDLSLSRCGLIFAGAANTLSDEGFDDYYDDALLSGKELAELDFSQTELVILNCCQTGQGRLTEDGIYGLQRALKQAGAGAMLISLWNLSDYSSGIFLRFFYEEIKKQPNGKIDLHTALLTAREKLMSHERLTFAIDEATLCIKPEKILYNTPRHTCPFILIDAF